MFKKNKNRLILTLMLIGLSLACGLTEQTEEANKLVDEANALIEKNNELIDRSNELFMELMGDNLTGVTDIKAYKQQNKTKFDEVDSLSGQIEKFYEEITDRFEQASKLKLSEKYKQYLDIKTREIKKRSEAQKSVTPFIKEFRQSTDVNKINRLIEDFNKQSAVSTAEIDKLSEQARQLAGENPEIIKN